MRVVVTGAGGQLGSALRRALTISGAAVIGTGARPAVGVDRVVDVTNADDVRRAFAAEQPDAVIHAAAYTDVDGCERDPDRAMAVNADGARHVAEAARAAGAYLIAVSTDFVFPGDGGAPYAEDAPTGPISAYGRGKLAGEQAVLAADLGFAVARTAWLYGGAGKHFPRTVLTVLRDRGGMEVVTDEAGNPTLADDLADALVALLDRRGSGIFHLVNEGRVTRYDFARAVATAAGLAPDLVQPVTTAEFLAKYPLPAKRPADSALKNIRAAALGIRLRPWQEAVAAFVPFLATELGVEGGKV
ncbi:MAG: dTDP-4-dehydrorhamnose reductase [Thermomicrobiales bacterium]